MIDLIIPTLVEMFTWPAPLYLLIGTILGLMVGILPGLGGAQMLALLVPFVISMEPAMAVVLLMGIMGANATGSSLTAILMATPGSAQSAATVFDGFQLAKQGKAGYAIGAAVSASMFGGIFGAIILTMILPFGKYIVLAFSYQEYFMMAILGLSVIAVLSQGSLWKGIISGCLGILIASIGFDPVTGETRYTFGSYYLYDGIKLVPAVVGLFAINEAISIFIKKGSIADKEINKNITGVWDGIKAPFKHFPTFLRGSIIGTFTGIIPGVGGAVANFLSYGQEVQAAKNPENFGKGDIRGVIAPEAANNAKDGGGMVPTLIFGIPGTAEKAVLLGTLIILGIQPGPRMMLDNGDIVLLLIYTLVFSNVLVALLSLAVANQLARLTFISGTVIGGIILAIAFIGAYAAEFMIQDVIVCLIFGLIGLSMDRYGYSKVALLIALVLGVMMQQSFHQTLQAAGWESFFTRPFSLVLFLTTLFLFVYPFYKTWKKGKNKEVTK
jgi:putative tricarboxylic transport membrane protein